MKKTLISAISLILSLVFCLSLISCGKEYRDDMTAEALASLIKEKVPTTEGYRKSDDDFIFMNLTGAGDLISEEAIYFASKDTNMNEIGVLRAISEDDAKTLASIVRTYIKNRQANWNYEYLPAENPKIEKASVEVYGTYVIYTFLTEADAKAVYELMESTLTK